MTRSDLSQLISSLREKTGKKEAVWKQTSRPSEFKLQLKSSGITIDCYNDGSDDIMEIVILNKEGAPIVTEKARLLDNLYADLFQLYTSVKSSYYKVDETIKDIFAELKSNEIIGENEEDTELPF